MCETCLKQCVAHGDGCCRRCGATLHLATCVTCEQYIRHLHELHAAYRYGGPVRPLIHRFKYDGIHATAEWMADRMPVSWLPPEAVLVPVPLHRARERERGYNQSQLLAHALGKRTGLPVVSILARTRHTSSQAHGDAAGRWLNVRDAFELKRQLELACAVVLVDDVCTTGATLDECAKVLSAAGVGKVSALVFARA